MPDELFEHPRVVAVYDALEGDRTDLAVYDALADDLDAHRVIDVGCGTGTFALMLADRGLDVTGVDPAHGSLEVARRKTGAGHVQWIHGTAMTLEPMHADLATMTGNVAQAIVTRADWEGTLRGVHRALRPGGYLVFETRDPSYQAWKEWRRATSYRVSDIPGFGSIENWVDVTAVEWPLVTFRGTYVFHSDGHVLTSDSTLRFRERDELEDALTAHGYVVDDVREAPDRPGRELVFIARKEG